MSISINDSKRILIVDDDPDVRLFLNDRLHALGFHPVLAVNGQEGLKVLEDQELQGVLLDIEMPIMGGMEMLNHLRQISTTLPVIMMSADEFRMKLLEAIIQGATDFLIKPIRQEDLAEKCWRLFR